MITTGCAHHGYTGLALCFNKYCSNRIICQDHSCFRLHNHDSYRMEVIMLDAIRDKRARAKQILNEVMQFLEETLARCRKNMAIAFGNFLNESQRIQEFDLDQIDLKEVTDFMDADITNEQFRIDLKKTLDRLSAETNSFKEDCFKKYKTDKTTQLDAEKLGFGKKKKNKKKEQRAQQVMRPNRPPYVSEFHLAVNPEGLLASSLCLKLENVQHSTNCAAKLFELLSNKKVEVENRLFVGKDSDRQLLPLLDIMEKNSPTLLLIKCETTHAIPEERIFGMLCNSRLIKHEHCGTIADFMFEVRSDRTKLFECSYTSEQVKRYGTTEIVDSTFGDNSISLSLGLSELVIPNRYTRYRSQMIGTGMFNLSTRMSLQVKQLELFAVKLHPPVQEAITINQHTAGFSEIYDAEEYQEEPTDNNDERDYTTYEQNQSVEPSEEE